ncbi:MAG: SCO family protein [Chloroflexota bacterium]|nr:SCO family protein [Chloroflexota bacterium]
MASLTSASKAGRRGPLTAIVAAAIVVVIVAAVVVVRGRSAGQLAGGTFTDTPPASDFVLPDQNGQMVRMANLRGKVVALTFLYTNCPDVCPVIATNLGLADHRLGATAQQLQIVAVSVDPAGDTLANVKKFTQSHGLAGLDNWHYLMGSLSQLQPVWKAYHVGSSASSGHNPEGLEHSALVYLVDPTGKLRVILPANFTIEDLVQDVRVLAGS